MCVEGWPCVWEKNYEGPYRGFCWANSGFRGHSLARVAPEYHQRRRHDVARLTNPVPYTANYYGHKLHVDQNEKLVMYGVTQVCAIDGFSKYILACYTMAVKNNLIIYEQLCRCVAFLLFFYY